MKMIVLLLLISQYASGVEVYEGAESVLLHCQVSVGVSSSDTAAVWDRVGLSNPTVHLRMQKSDNLDERDDLSGQNDLYQHRTSMRVDALQTGDLSLTLRKPTFSDSGTYTCIYRKYGEDQSKTEVQLKVTEPPPPPLLWPKVLAAVLVALIILAAAIGLFVYCAYKRMKDSEALLPEVVEVPQGEESALLPFKTTAVLPQDVTVKWRHSNNMKVHVYESGKNQPDKQDQVYRGRTEMDEDPLRTKDFSLTLKDLRPTDSGVYTCTVCNKDGHMLLQKVVTLIVTVPQPEVVNATAADESVLLPFKTTADIRQDVTVEWTVTEPTERKVHVYKSENNQSHNQDQCYIGRTEMNKDPLRRKDLSLTLKDLHLTDSGVYTCTVYNKDGHMLLQKSVTLHVYDDTMRSLATVYGNKSYLLEFEKPNKLDQISKVQWERIYPKHKFMKEITRHQGNEEDLSLNLEDIHLTDSGIYTCTAYDKDGHKLLKRSVVFSVRDFQLEMVEVTEGEESVLLPFKTTADPNHVFLVYWAVSEPPQAKFVHYFDVYKNNQEGLQDQAYIGRTEMNEDPLRTGDLSLTLRKPLPTDSRSYTCTVLNKDKRMLQQKVVILRVRATLKGAIEDMLPCLRRRRAPKPEVKEDVRNTDQEDVPLMEVHSA